MSEENQYPPAGVYAPVAPGAAAAVAQTSAAGAYAAPAAVGAGTGAGAGVASAAAKPKKNTGYVVAIVILSVLLVLSIGVAGCSMMTAATSGLSSLFSFTSGSGYFISGPTVAVIDIDSTIQHGGGNCSPEGLSQLMEEVEANDNIKAVVLHVNSGGGASTAGEEMSILIAQCTKPVVVSSASTNASAAYEISSQADYIFVDKSTFIGSIGTALQFVDLSGLYEKLGINYQNILSDPSKDASYGNRPLTEAEIAHYQAMVTQVNEEFIKTVAEGRGMSVEAVRALAHGELFTGMTAIENGLADEIGTFEDACAYAAKLGGIEGDGYDVVNISYTSYDFDVLSLLGMDADLSVDQLAEIIGSIPEVRFWSYNGAYAAK